jgi:UDP-N-acetylglucosamine 2-epimerase (non-hydrolysing)
MKIMLVAGARPNFMKIASIVYAIEKYNESASSPIVHVLVHTGQHYDDEMSDVFFKELRLPSPHVNLGVGSSSHAAQTAEIMKRFEPVLVKEKPDVLMVVGDVNSTIACCLVAAKIVYPDGNTDGGRRRPVIAHVEAGLRSFDRSMPEEINRILTDSLSDVLFTTEANAEFNLSSEGIDSKKIFFVGNTMVDTLLRHKQSAQASDILNQLGVARNGSGKVDPYAVVTLHRPSNVDDGKIFCRILEALKIVGKRLPIFFPMHPRTMSRMKELKLDHMFSTIGESCKGLIGLRPLSYFDFLSLMSHARLIMTDSGGVQEEATVLGIPCVTLRENTERPVTVSDGTNVVAGTSTEDIVRHAFGKIESLMIPKQPDLWDGRAGDRIINVLTEVVTEVHI